MFAAAAALLAAGASTQHVSSSAAVAAAVADATASATTTATASASPVTSLTKHYFKPFEVSAPHIIYAGFGTFVVLFACFSLFIKEKLFLGEAPLAAVFGIIVGPYCLKLFDPSHWGKQRTDNPPGTILTDDVTIEVLRVTIALSVFAAGVELPKRYMARHWRSILILLGPVMLWGWLTTAFFLWAFIPGLDYLTSLVVAAAVTPTDPILSASVVGGSWAEKHVPSHIRHLLACESGCNDGAAFPFLYLAMYLTQNRHDVGWAIGRWVYQILLWEIALGTVIGGVVGWAARKVIRLSERWHLVDRESFVVHYVALALLSVGINVLLGSDDLLAAFAAGTAFAWDGWFDAQTESSNFSSVVDLLFNTATFVYLGAMMPFDAWVAPDTSLDIWRLFVIAILTILLKRIPVIIALWKFIPDVKTFRDALFVGHFGPMGCGAIFISTLGRTLLPDQTPQPAAHPNHYLANSMIPITYFLVLCSIAVHGLTVPFFSAARNSTKKLHESFSHGGLSTTVTWESWGTLAFNRFRTFGSEKHPRRSRTRNSSGDAGGMEEIRRILASQLPSEQQSGAASVQPRRLRAEESNYSGIEDIRRALSSQPNDSCASNDAQVHGSIEGARQCRSSGENGEPTLATSTAALATSLHMDMTKTRLQESERALLTPASAAQRPSMQARTISFACHDTFDNFEDASAHRDLDPGTGDWEIGENDAEIRRIRQHAYLTRQGSSASSNLRTAFCPRQEPSCADRFAVVSRMLNAAISVVHQLRSLVRGGRSEPSPPLERLSDEERKCTARDGCGAPGRDEPGLAIEEIAVGQSAFAANETVAYPMVHERIEGSQLVLEYLPEHLAEAVVSVLPLNKEDCTSWDRKQQTVDKLEQSTPSPAWWWVCNHREELKALVPDLAPSTWTPHNACFALIKYQVPTRLAEWRRNLRLDHQHLRLASATRPASDGALRCSSSREQAQHSHAGIGVCVQEDIDDETVYDPLSPAVSRVLPALDLPSDHTAEGDLGFSSELRAAASASLARASDPRRVHTTS